MILTVKKAVVLFSGGLDSSTVLALAKSNGLDVYALTIDYGQRHIAEIRASERVAASIGVADHKTVRVDLASIGGSALTDQIDVPKDSSDAEGIPVTYVPARNTIMLAVALGYAEVLQSDDLYCGVNAVDYSGYPDCRPEFVAAFETLANVATKRAVEGNRMNLHAPLIQMRKREIIELGLRLGVDYGLTHSCYDPSADGYPCGRCDSCAIRRSAFAEVGMEDPALVR